MRRRWSFVFLLGGLALSSALSIVAQTGSGRAEGSGTEAVDDKKSPLPYKIKGEDARRYYVVQQFFQIAYPMTQSPDTREIFIMQLGLEPGTNAEQTLLHAVERAHLLFYGEDPHVEVEESIDENGMVRTTQTTRSNVVYKGPSDKGKSAREFASDLRGYHAQRARQLGDIFGELVHGLREQNVSMAGIEKYFAEELTARTAFSSDRSSDDPSNREPADAFDEQVRRYEHDG